MGSKRSKLARRDRPFFGFGQSGLSCVAAVLLICSAAHCHTFIGICNILNQHNKNQQNGKEEGIYDPREEEEIDGTPSAKRAHERAPRCGRWLAAEFLS